jgi:hypothetical protein
VSESHLLVPFSNNNPWTLLADFVETGQRECRFVHHSDNSQQQAGNKPRDGIKNIHSGKCPSGSWNKTKQKMYSLCPENVFQCKKV